MLPAAPGEDRPYTPWPAEDTERPAPGAEAARDTHDGDGQTDDDWFEDDGRESDAHVAEPVSPTPAFNDLRGIEKLASSSAVAEDAPFRSAGNVKGVDVQGDERLDASADEDPVADAGTPRPSPFTASAEYAPPSPAPGSVGSRDVVAGALERIALRIRDGEMPLPGDLPASDEAALAAVLAAMLRLPTR